MFSLDLVPSIDITSTDTPKGRYYSLPDGKQFPSVTTVIQNSDAFDFSFLEKWKARVGEDEADQVSVQARNRGEGFHHIVERFLLNDPLFKKGVMPLDIENWLKVKEPLLNNLKTIKGVETPVYSDVLNTAGRIDCFGLWGNRMSVVDFKTSKKPKKETDIENYFVQTNAYGQMIEERFGLSVEQTVIIMINDESRIPQIFIRDMADFREKTLRIFKGDECMTKLMAA